MKGGREGGDNLSPTLAETIKGKIWSVDWLELEENQGIQDKSEIVTYSALCKVIHHTL